MQAHFSGTHLLALRRMASVRRWDVASSIVDGDDGDDGDDGSCRQPMKPSLKIKPGRKRADRRRRARKKGKLLRRVCSTRPAWPAL